MVYPHQRQSKGAEGIWYGKSQRGLQEQACIPTKLQIKEPLRTRGVRRSEEVRKFPDVDSTQDPIGAIYSWSVAQGLQLVSWKHLLCKLSAVLSFCPVEWWASVTQQCGLWTHSCFWSAVSVNWNCPNGFIFSFPFSSASRPRKRQWLLRNNI